MIKLKLLTDAVIELLLKRLRASSRARLGSLLTKPINQDKLLVI
jgi:hypothetical protein